MSLYKIVQEPIFQIVSDKLASEKINNLFKITIETVHVFLYKYIVLYPKTSHFVWLRFSYHIHF